MRRDPDAFRGFVNDGTLTIANASATFQGVVDNEGTLQIGNGGTSGSVTGDVVDNGVLVFNRASGVVYSGGISGSGSLTKTGAGTLALTGNNTYTGADHYQQRDHRCR